MKRFKISLAVLAIVLATASAFTSIPQKHVSWTPDYQIRSVNQGALAFPDNTYSDFTTSNSTFQTDEGSTANGVAAYLSNSGHSCSNVTNGTICAVELDVVGQTVIDQTQGDFN